MSIRLVLNIHLVNDEASFAVQDLLGKEQKSAMIEERSLWATNASLHASNSHSLHPTDIILAHTVTDKTCINTNAATPYQATKSNKIPPTQI